MNQTPDNEIIQRLYPIEQGIKPDSLEPWSMVLKTDIVCRGRTPPLFIECRGVYYYYAHRLLDEDYAHAYWPYRPQED